MGSKGWGKLLAGLALLLPLATAAQQSPSREEIIQQLQRNGVPAQSVQSPRITNSPQGPLTPQQLQQPGIPQPGGIASPPDARLVPGAPSAALPGPDDRLEFEHFIARSLGRELPLYGHNLFTDASAGFAPLDQVSVPADYVLGPGDELYIRAWGQIDIDYQAVVDRDGRIYIPKVGAINVAGLPYQDLDGLVRRAVGRIYKNFELNASLGQLRSIQVYVVGQARRPGSYVVSSLSTLVNALFASGGPSHKGSMRKVQLKRANKVVTEFDLYDLILRGDKSKDAKLLPGDVIFIPPVGQLVAISGSVNLPAIYEIKDPTNLGELVAMAGGLAATAAGQKVTLERIAARMTRQVEEFPLDAGGYSRTLKDGDLVNVYALSPKIDNAITLRGNVAGPMRFPWRSGLRVKDVIPEKDALVVPDYWIRKNETGIGQSWIGNAVKRPGELTAGERAQIEKGDPAVLRNQVVRSASEINWDYAVIERLNFDDLTTQLIPFNLNRAIVAGDPDHNLALQPGDIVTIFSKDDIRVPLAKQTKYVRLEGEFVSAGVYQVNAGETLRDLVMRVGGFTSNAYLYGAEFTRESTRVEQQVKLDEALDRLEQEAQRAAAGRSASTVDPRDAENIKVEVAAQQRLIDRLRLVKATGRIVLELPSEGAGVKNIPPIALEDGDRLYIPSPPSTVNVFGSVYNQNAFIFRGGKRVGDYLSQAGGPTKDADKGSIYLVKADGSVVSRRQSGTVFGSFDGQKVMPGDAIVVPEDFDKFRWTKELKDWSQIFYQFALGVAGLKVLKDL
jgi:protein involved in polysaccharide export with SLBB domain